MTKIGNHELIDINKQTESFMRNMIKYILKYKEKKTKFTMEKLGRHHLQQVIKVSTILNETKRNYLPPDKMQPEHSVTNIECQLL